MSRIDYRISKVSTPSEGACRNRSGGDNTEIERYGDGHLKKRSTKCGSVMCIASCRCGTRTQIFLRIATPVPVQWIMADGQREIRVPRRPIDTTLMHALVVKSSDNIIILLQDRKTTRYLRIFKTKNRLSSRRTPAVSVCGRRLQVSRTENESSTSGQLMVSTAHTVPTGAYAHSEQ